MYKIYFTEKEAKKKYWLKNIIAGKTVSFLCMLFINFFESQVLLLLLFLCFSFFLQGSYLALRFPVCLFVCFTSWTCMPQEYTPLYRPGTRSTQVLICMLCVLLQEEMQEEDNNPHNNAGMCGVYDADGPPHDCLLFFHIHKPISWR